MAICIQYCMASIVKTAITTTSCARPQLQERNILCPQSRKAQRTLNMHTTVFLLVLLLLLAQVSNSNCLIVTGRGSSVVSSINTSWRQFSAFSLKHRSQQQYGVAALKMKSNKSNNGLKSSERNDVNNTTPLKSFFGPKLILPTIIIVLAITRPIPMTDRFFSIGYPIYMYLANRFRFANNAPSIAKFGGGNDVFKKLPLIREGAGPWFQKYGLTFAGIGIILPLLTQIIAPKAIADAAAPHLYLTLCQVAMESKMKGPKFHSLIELLNPIGFNAYRLICLKTWLTVAYQSVVTSTSSTYVGSYWEVFSLALALSNTIIWTYNLFVFLLLRTLPQYLDRNKFPDVDNISWKGQIIPILSE